MMLEITGSRILAPFLGTSTFVWTSLIGIILASLSLGYHLGGKLSDKKPSLKTLSSIIFLSALLIALTAIFHGEILRQIELLVPDLRLAASISAIVLFTPASVFLGMISPYTVRLKMTSIKHSGETVGNLYAISTIGSIVGTFLTGFFLLAYIGSTSLLFLLSLIMVGLSFALTPHKHKIFVFLFTCLYLGSFQIQKLEAAEHGYFDLDSDYNHIKIFPNTDRSTGKDILTLSLSKNNSSAMFLENEDLVFSYTMYYHLAHHFNPELKNTLMIGGGAYSFPKNFLEVHPEATIDVVEIDPRLTELATEYFRLESTPRLQSFHEDGRAFLNHNEKFYDAIFIDAFQGSYAIPHHLTTTEAVAKMASSLNDDGVLLVNVISKLEGEGSEFLQAEYRTFKEHFPRVEIFAVRSQNRPDMLQNFMLVAFKSPKEPIWESKDALLNKFLQKRYKKAVPTELPILTDDFAPVDHYVMKLL